MTPSARMLLTGLLVLFFELFCIRWFPAQVRHLGYFTNFVLLAAFLGIGVGTLVGRKRGSLLHLFPACLLVALGVVLAFRLEMRISSPDVVYFQNSRQDMVPVEPVFMIPVLFVALAALFVVLSAELAPLFRALPPLQAYRANLLGSLAGIAAFSLLGWLSLPPVAWLLVLFAVYFALAGRSRGLGIQVALALLALALTAAMDAGNTWSPYYKIEKKPLIHQGQAIGWDVWVNNTGHQMLIPSRFVDQEPMYGELFRLFPERAFRRILVIGAGGGRDTAYLLARTGGAVEIDAVDIDPVLLGFGLSAHPERPYLNPQVTTHAADGRHFLARAEGPYDCIVFALPDSLVLASSYSSLRLESYLFTVESFREARRLLADDGVFLLYNGFRRPWLVEKLAGMLEAAFGQKPMVSSFPDQTTCLVTGPGAKDLPPASYTAHPPATDDWPFLYLKEPSFPGLYLGMAGLVAAVAVAAVALAGGLRLHRSGLVFFLLGAAFMLLECRSVVVFSLLFGSTWQVNSAVFAVILLLVLAAVEINARRPLARPGLLYGALLAALGAAWLVPPALFLGNAWAGAIFYLLPIFLANLVFTREFRDAEEADAAYAANVLGAVAGGLAEYLAMVTGYHALLVLVALLYAGAATASGLRPGRGR